VVSDLRSMDDVETKAEYKEKIPKEIKNLIEKFERNLPAYKSKGYNETQLREEFINPFFEALGWDIYNRSGIAPAYRDVIHEDSIKMAGGTKAPDYCFTLAGRRMFFVETKKPSVDIKTDIHPAFQLRRYAWSAKLPLSILTDFEEFAVYEARQPPKKGDKASKERIMYFTYRDYIEKWSEITNIFSKRAVLQGSFDKFIESSKKKRGTQEVDDAFLGEIEGWRDILSRNIAIRNPTLSRRELNYSVQRTIDRIIFLRMCEDRGIERYGQLHSLIKGDNIYSNLCDMFITADEKYNSGLFHFNKERGRNTLPDELTLHLKIEDKVLKEIIKNIYYPESPYEFSVLSPEILGNVYEQFLGKVIRLTENHRAKIEEKPEVKKAGGVFYTPQYIVDYIVLNTVGVICKGKTPNQIEKLKFLDASCGSGSFLLGIYAYLLQYHLDYYSKGKNPKRYKEQIYQGKNGQWFLTIKEKKRILLNNVFGVDIDNQAVEVTKLSLLLKVLEGENRDVFEKQQKLWRERALPDLGSNIKWGNSLIGPDFYTGGTQTTLFDDDVMYRVNAFDWEREFPDIVNNRGFDAVIGNPPYIRIQAMKEWAPLEVEYYKQRFASASKGNYDIYVAFVEKGLELLNDNGRFGFILPNKFFNALYGANIRKILAEGRNLSKIVHFGDQQVFSGSTTYTCLLFLDKLKKRKFEFHMAENLVDWKLNGKSTKGKISLNDVKSDEWNFVVGEQAELFNKLRKMPMKLENIAEKIYQGLITGADSVFILKNVSCNRFISDATKKEYSLEKDLIHPLCKGSVDIKRYFIGDLTKSILFPYKIENGQAQLLSTQELEKNYPLIWKYLLENRNTLESRERGKWKHNRWYAFGRSQNLNAMEQKKILTPSIADSASFTVDLSGKYYFVGSGGGGGGGYGITLKNDIEVSYEYVLGVLNSKLIDRYLKSISSRFSGGYYAYNRQYIEKLPIRTIDFKEKSDKIYHDKIVSLVEQIYDIYKRLSKAKMSTEKAILQRQIDTIEQQINQHVYELYDLTEKEIKMVERET